MVARMFCFLSAVTYSIFTYVTIINHPEGVSDREGVYDGRAPGSSLRGVRKGASCSQAEVNIFSSHGLDNVFLLAKTTCRKHPSEFTLPR